MDETSSKTVITQGIEKDTRIPLANHFKEDETKTNGTPLKFMATTIRVEPATFSTTKEPALYSQTNKLNFWPPPEHDPSLEGSLEQPLVSELRSKDEIATNSDKHFLAVPLLTCDK